MENDAVMMNMNQGIGIQNGENIADVPSMGNEGDQPSQQPQYTMPGILHFMQTEWARFEMERSQWDVERAELQARIAFLQGERQGQENLKKDLVRRIKMLEFALKQERARFNKLSNLKTDGDSSMDGLKLMEGGKNGEDDMYDIDAMPEMSKESTEAMKQGRQLLRQYLQEIGYTETLMNVRSSRVKALLGIQGEKDLPNGETPGSRLSNKATKRNQSALNQARSAYEESEESVLDTYGFLSNEGRSGRLEEKEAGEPPDSDDSAKQRFLGGPESDPDTEEALAEFDFLCSETSSENNNANAVNQQSNNRDGGPWSDGMDDNNQSGGGNSGTRDIDVGEEWSVDARSLNRLKEMYRQERQGKKSPKLSSHAQGEFIDTIPHGGHSDTGTDDIRFGDAREPPEIDDLGIQGGGSMPFIGAGAKSSSPSSTTGPSSLNIVGGAEEIGALASLDISNESENVSYESHRVADENIRKRWQAKYNLRSHFDGVRSLVFHPVEPVLITASEDETLKLWNLTKTLPAKKNQNLDVEPVYTFRGHVGAVLSVLMSATGEQCYSSGIDGIIRVWNIPNSNIEPYDSYDASIMANTLSGHTDAVWGLALHSSRQHLLSCGADGTVRLWNPDGSHTPLLNTFVPREEYGNPTCIDFVRCENSQMIASYESGVTIVYDLETGKPLLTFDPLIQDMASTTTSESPSINKKQRESLIAEPHINSLICHPTLPITVTGYTDGSIHFFDNSTGKRIHKMGAHEDAVTSLAIDPNGLYLLSGSHDCSMRLWTLDSKTCIQEITAHRKKYDESIHSVAFHPTKPYLASAGADALAKVFV